MQKQKEKQTDRKAGSPRRARLHDAAKRVFQKTVSERKPAVQTEPSEEFNMWTKKESKPLTLKLQETAKEVAARARIRQLQRTMTRIPKLNKSDETFAKVSLKLPSKAPKGTKMSSSVYYTTEFLRQIREHDLLEKIKPFLDKEQLLPTPDAPVRMSQLKVRESPRCVACRH